MTLDFALPFLVLFYGPLQKSETASQRMNMNKHDLILAKKALSARQVKTEHKVIIIFYFKLHSYVSNDYSSTQLIQSVLQQRSGNSKQLGLSQSINGNDELQRSLSSPKLPDITQSVNSPKTMNSWKSESTLRPSEVRYDYFNLNLSYFLNSIYYIYFNSCNKCRKELPCL